MVYHLFTNLDQQETNYQIFISGGYVYRTWKLVDQLKTSLVQLMTCKKPDTITKDCILLQKQLLY